MRQIFNPFGNYLVGKIAKNFGIVFGDFKLKVKVYISSKATLSSEYLVTLLLNPKFFLWADP